MIGAFIERLHKLYCKYFGHVLYTHPRIISDGKLGYQVLTITRCNRCHVKLHEQLEDEWPGMEASRWQISRKQ